MNLYRLRIWHEFCAIFSVNLGLKKIHSYKFLTGFHEENNYHADEEKIIFDIRSDIYKVFF